MIEEYRLYRSTGCVVCTGVQVVGFVHGSLYRSTGCVEKVVCTGAVLRLPWSGIRVSLTLTGTSGGDFFRNPPGETLHYRPAVVPALVRPLLHSCTRCGVRLSGAGQNGHPQLACSAMPHQVDPTT